MVNGFWEIKYALTQAVVLGISDLRKSFMLYISEEREIVVGALMQMMRQNPCPMAYFPNLLEGIAAI